MPIFALPNSLAVPKYPPAAACACTDVGEMCLLRTKRQEQKQRNTTWARQVFVFEKKGRYMCN